MRFVISLFLPPSSSLSHSSRVWDQFDTWLIGAGSPSEKWSGIAAGVGEKEERGAREREIDELTDPIRRAGIALPGREDGAQRRKLGLQKQGWQNFQTACQHQRRLAVSSPYNLRNEERIEATFQHDIMCVGEPCLGRPISYAWDYSPLCVLIVAGWGALRWAAFPFRVATAACLPAVLNIDQPGIPDVPERN